MSYKDLSLDWLLFVNVESDTFDIDTVIDSCKDIERFAYLLHVPFGMKPHYHVYIRFKTLYRTSMVKKLFTCVLADPNVNEKTAIEYLFRVKEPLDAMIMNFKSKYEPKRLVCDLCNKYFDGDKNYSTVPVYVMCESCAAEIKEKPLFKRRRVL